MLIQPPSKRKAVEETWENNKCQKSRQSQKPIKY